MEEVYEQVSYVIKDKNVIQLKSIRFLIPAFLSDDEMSDMFGMTHQEFYELRDEYVTPFLATAGPRGGQRQRI